MRSVLLLLSVSFLLAGSALANTVDVRFLRTIPLGETPLQTAVTSDGQRIYVLSDKGNIHLFAADGSSQGSFDAGAEVSGIIPQGKNVLLLQIDERKELVQVMLEPVVQIAIDGAPLYGNPDAPVTIVIFDDFECPYCAKAVPLVKEVLAAYPEQVKLAYKNFPLGMHKHARAAAIAGLAADRQGKFWPLHDLLFANYNKLNPQLITALAKQAGLDMVKFAQDQKNTMLEQQLNADIQQGKKIGVRGTPSIFINGRRLPQRSRAAFDQLIQAELANIKAANTAGEK